MKPLPHLLIAVIFAAPLTSNASTMILNPSQDNTIYSGSFYENNSNGQGYLFAGRIASGDRRRSLLAFDLGGIPGGATVMSVQLILSVNKATGTVSDFSLYRLLQNWGEGASDAGEPGGQGVPAQAGDATWNAAFFPGTLWSTPGGNFLPSISATTSVGFEGSYTWTSGQMVANVQGWLAQPSTNFGWLLKDAETVTSAKRFDSGEAIASNRPRLVITYEAVPEPSVVALLTIAAFLAPMGRRRSRSKSG